MQLTIRFLSMLEGSAPALASWLLNALEAEALETNPGGWAEPICAEPTEEDSDEVVADVPRVMKANPATTIPAAPRHNPAQPPMTALRR